MACSKARLAANRANALKSTGPKTPGGKAAARWNASRHGMAGDGDLIGPEDDEALVIERTGAFVRELRATGEAGHLLARRAALLSTRMERATDRNEATVAVDVAEARAGFDHDRADELADRVAALEAGEDDSHPILEALEGSPDGVDRLLELWGEVRDALIKPGSDASRTAADRAARWLGLGDPEDEGSHAPTRLFGRVEAELARLCQHAGSPELAAAADRIAEARRRVGLLASFDPSSEAALGHRYEAAAERGMYRALRAIADLNRQGSREAAKAMSPASTLAALDKLARTPRAAAPTPKPTPPVASFGSASRNPSSSARKTLGSFRNPGWEADSNPLDVSVGLRRSEPTPDPSRKRRPDLRKLVRTR